MGNKGTKFPKCEFAEKVAIGGVRACRLKLTFAEEESNNLVCPSTCLDCEAPPICQALWSAEDALRMISNLYDDNKPTYQLAMALYEASGMATQTIAEIERLQEGEDASQ